MLLTSMMIKISIPIRSFCISLFPKWAWGASQAALVVKNLPANAGDMRDMGLIPGWGRSPGGGHGNPLQCLCLENPKDRGAWRAAVHRVAESDTMKRLSRLALNNICFIFLLHSFVILNAIHVK